MNNKITVGTRKYGYKTVSKGTSKQLKNSNTCFLKNRKFLLSVLLRAFRELFFGFKL